MSPILTFGYQAPFENVILCNHVWDSLSAVNTQGDR